MFEQLKIYHTKHGEGVIIKYEKGLYHIDFCGTVKKVSTGNWLSILFLDRKDAYKKKEHIDKNKYNEIIAYESEFTHQMDENKKQTNAKCSSIGYHHFDEPNIREEKDRFWIEVNKYQPNCRNNVTNDFNSVKNELGEEEKYTDKNCYINVDLSEEQGYFADYYPGHQDYEIDDIVHEAYAKYPWGDPDSPAYVQQDVDNLEPRSFIHEMYQKKADKLLLNPEMVDKDQRCVILLCIEKIVLSHKDYIKIVGIDVQTAKLISIVDTNGKEKGLHSYSYKFRQLIGKSVVIKAKFECLNHPGKQNILRIVSDYTIVNDFKIDTLQSLDFKYDVLSSGRIKIISNFDDVKSFIDIYGDKSIYFLVNFTDTTIAKDEKRNNLYIHMKGEYPVIRDKKFMDEANVGKHYRGLALLTWWSTEYGKIIFNVEKMFARIMDEAEIQKYKNKKVHNEFSDEINFETDLEDFESYNEEVANQYTYESLTEQEEPYYFDEHLDRYVSYYEVSSDEEMSYTEDEEYLNFRRQEDAYWFCDDEYVEGGDGNNDFLW